MIAVGWAFHVYPRPLMLPTARGQSTTAPRDHSLPGPGPNPNPNNINSNNDYNGPLYPPSEARGGAGGKTLAAVGPSLHAQAACCQEGKGDNNTDNTTTSVTTKNSLSRETFLTILGTAGAAAAWGALAHSGVAAGDDGKGVAVATVKSSRAAVFGEVREIFMSRFGLQSLCSPRFPTPAIGLRHAHGMVVTLGFHSCTMHVSWDV